MLCCTYRCTPAPIAASKRLRVPSRRMRSLPVQSDGAPGRGTAVARCSAASQPWAAERRDARSRISPSTASTPTRRRRSACAAPRTTAHTRHPRSSRRGTTLRPRTPVAPTTKARTTFPPSGDAPTRRRPRPRLPEPRTPSAPPPARRLGPPWSARTRRGPRAPSAPPRLAAPPRPARGESLSPRVHDRAAAPEGTVRRQQG